jgi:hypothetical protein
MAPRRVLEAIILISAVHALIRQCASLAFDTDLIQLDQIGRRRWTKLGGKEEIQETYEILGDASEHEQGQLL